MPDTKKIMQLKLQMASKAQEQRKQPEETPKTQSITTDEATDSSDESDWEGSIPPLPQQEEAKVVNTKGEICKTCVHCRKKEKMEVLTP